ncbi:MAG: hypothetical protein PHH23_01580 [Paludibacteraceae bacterium]|nr:hypothetical protein [Paludibacteraceae bacterium]
MRTLENLFQLILAVTVAILCTVLVIAQWYLAGVLTWYIGLFILLALITYLMVWIVFKEFKEEIKK